MTPRRAALAVIAISVAVLGVLLGATPASAHVVPSTTIALDVHERTISAKLTLPSRDLSIASEVEMPARGALSMAAMQKIDAYLEAHLHVSSHGRAWQVAVTDVGTTEIEQWGTGLFPATTATAVLTPARGGDLRSFTLDYDAIVHQVVTADIFVTLHSDWATGTLGSARTLGTIKTDTVTGVVPSLPVALDSGSTWQGFTGMVSLGISHIAEGTDHQLFLLTLLLPAPLIAVSRRWAAVAPPRRAVRRITAVTIAFTIGHSVTLALGALGLPVPQQAVEVMIAGSILVAAIHAIRPIFPGREPVIAAAFGLVHGMAFSTTLTELDLSGGQLVLSLLGFNLGIELMQLAVVLVVLPPLIVLARTAAYPPLRVIVAVITGLAAVGWVLDRVGVPNPVARAADLIGIASPWIAAGLWLAAFVALTIGRRGRAASDLADQAGSADLSAKSVLTAAAGN